MMVEAGWIARKPVGGQSRLLTGAERYREPEAWRTVGAIVLVAMRKGKRRHGSANGLRRFKIVQYGQCEERNDAVHYPAVS